MYVTVTLENVRTAPHGQVIIGLEIDGPDPAEQEADQDMGDGDSSARAAAVVWNEITRNAVFTVNGKSYEASECAEWWA